MQTIGFDAHLDQAIHSHCTGLMDAIDVSADDSITAWNAVIGRYDGEDWWTAPAEADLKTLEEIAQGVVGGYTDLPDFVVSQFESGLDEIEAWRKNPNEIPATINGEEW